jgi:hypothetical protein
MKTWVIATTSSQRSRNGGRKPFRMVMIIATMIQTITPMKKQNTVMAMAIIIVAATLTTI